MDSENSGAIFRLKNLALVRSPHVVPAPVTKETDSRLSSTKMKSVTSEQSAAINAIFDQIYRATPLPTTMLQNSNYNSSFWDTGLQFPPDAPGISPIYGFSHSSSSSQSGGVDQPYYERAQQLRLNHVQPIPQNQHPLTNSYAPTMIPPSNRQERIFDSSTYLQSQYHAGSHVHLHSESNDLPAENSLSNSILLKDGQNNPHESFFVMQDKKVSGDADEPTIDDIVDGDDYSTSTTGNLLLEVSNEDATAASNSSVSFAEIRNSNSASSSSKAQLPSTSTAAIGSPVDATSRPKLRRKFVMDSLFCLNMKPVTERHALSDNDSLSAEGFNDKTVKGMSFKKTAKLPSSGQKEVTGKKSAVILATNTSDYVKDNRISSQEKNDAHVDLESRGLGLTFASNSPRSKNSLSSNGKNGTTSSQSKSPSNFAAAQRHGSLILVPLAQLYSYSTASSSDDDFNNSYSKAKIKAKSAVKARIDRRKSSATKGTSRILDPEIGLDPLEPCKTDSEVCHVAIPIPSSGSVTLNQKDLGTAVSETSETEIGHSSIPLESVKTTVIAKVRASNRVKTPPSSSDSEVQTRCDPPSAGSSSLTRTTRSSVGGKIFIQSESSSGSARTGDGVRSEDGAHTESASIVRVLPSAAPTTRRTRRSVVDSDSDAPSCAAEWHQEEVFSTTFTHSNILT